MPKTTHKANRPIEITKLSSCLHSNIAGSNVVKNTVFEQTYVLIDNVYPSLISQTAGIDFSVYALALIYIWLFEAMLE